MVFDFKQQPGRYRREKNNFDRTAKPLISIVTAYYNAGRYFEQTFNSVMNQTFPWFEWIIVNDGSTNKYDVKFLEELCREDSRIKIIHQENGGLSCARNTAIKNSSTDIIIPLDADDLISPQYLEYLFWGLYYNPDAAWCYTCSVGFHAEEYLWKFPWDAERLKTYNFLNYSAAIRRKDIEEIGGYKVEKWAYFEDWRFWLEMLQKDKKPVHLGGYLFWYRRLKNGMLSTIRNNPEQKTFADNIIKDAAKTANGTVGAKEYPIIKSVFPYYKPKLINLGDEYNVKSNKIQILMIIPWMTLRGADKYNLDFIKNINQEKFDVSIVTTERSENKWQQRFENYTDKIFNLPEFLDPAYYLDFVAYYIQSRKIKIVFVTNSYKGYYMLPWLRKNFTQICIIDFVHAKEGGKDGGFTRISGNMGQFIDKTFVCNSAIKERMIKKFDRTEGRIKVRCMDADGLSMSIEKEISMLVCDDNVKEQHTEIAQMLKKQGNYAEEFYISNMAFKERAAECENLQRELYRRLEACESTLSRHEEIVNRHEEVVNRHEEVVNRHEEVVNRHEEVVNRHEEVINRHEEVVNRHEQVVNDDWAWLKSHEDRITAVEDKQKKKYFIRFK